MMKLGVVGTNWISKAFVDAAHATGEYQFFSVFSRSIEKGNAFADSCGQGIVHTDMSLFSKEEFDIAYVASPNALHYEHCCKLIEQKKHIIVEKPAFSNIEELEKIYDLAEQYGVFVFEAARHIHEANFKKLKKSLQTIGNITGASLTYMKYSSRYDAVKQGEEPNIFSLRYSGGALYDLGVYLVYAAIALFGEPKKAHYFPKIIQTGVDGIGQILFEYENFNVMMLTGKISDSNAVAEFFGDEGMITANSIEYIDSIVHNKKGKNLAEKPKKFTMFEEAFEFSRIIQTKNMADYDNLKQLSLSVHSTLTTMRKKNSIIFSADTQ